MARRGFVYPGPSVLWQADLGGRSAFYCLAGAGVTVILESDMGADHRAWDSVAPRIAKFARVLTYDRLGLGQSDPSDVPRTPDNLAAELDQLLTALGIEGPLVLVGHRQGGWALRSFAAQRDEGIRRLILVDSPHEDFERQVRLILAPDLVRRLDSAVVARRAVLPAPVRREHEQLAGAQPGTTFDAPVTMLRGGLAGVD